VAVSAAGRDLRPTIAVFFTTEERFPFVKALQIRNRIIPVVDDLAGRGAESGCEVRLTVSAAAASLRRP
jgi:hypothetical protein